MKTDHTLAAKCGEARETRAEKAIRLLTTRPANPFDEKLEVFKEFYPAIATAMNNGMKARPILKILAEGGLKLYPALLNNLITAMKEGAETPRCPHCRQAIQHPTVDAFRDTPAAINSEES